MSLTTWNPNDNWGEILSNGNLTSTFPGAGGNNNGVRATTPIQDGQKAYFEVDTSGFYAGSAFAIGVATGNWNLGDTGDGNGGLASFGDTTVHWDGIVDQGGNWVSNPHRTAASMDNGGHLDIAVDRVDGKFWWKSSLTNQWDENPNDDPATNSGGYDISSLQGSPLYPVMTDGTGGGPVATINGGSAPFHDAVPAGFIALDNLDGSGSTPAPAPTPAPPSDSAAARAAVPAAEAPGRLVPVRAPIRSLCGSPRTCRREVRRSLALRPTPRRRSGSTGTPMTRQTRTARIGCRPRPMDPGTSRPP